MISFLFLVGLNAVDAWLIGRDMLITEIALNPLVSPISANIVARSIIAAAIALLLFFMGKGKLVLWINVVMFVLVGWHLTVLILEPFNLVGLP